MTMSNYKPTPLETATDYLRHSKPRDFQYFCSFCWRELPDDGLRFAGFGVCPLHLKLAEKIVDLLRDHRARYFNSDFTEAK